MSEVKIIRNSFVRKLRNNHSKSVGSRQTTPTVKENVAIIEIYYRRLLRTQWSMGLHLYINDFSPFRMMLHWFHQDITKTSCVFILCYCVIISCVTAVDILPSQSVPKLRINLEMEAFLVLFVCLFGFLFVCFCFCLLTSSIAYQFSCLYVCLFVI